MGDHATRVVFLGTPEFAVSSLEALVSHPAFDVCGVVTQPDRPAGRGQQIVKSAVKLAAERNSITVFQPEKLRDPTAVDTLRAWAPDVMVVAAFGQILRQPVLEMPPHGCINVHASLLPRWRGAAPIQYAIRAGDEKTGITIMKMDAGLDTGAMLAWRAIPIMADETASTLHNKLASLAADFLPGALLDYLQGEITPQPQPEEGIILAPTIKKSEGVIDWSQTAITIDRHVRAFTPWPGTSTTLNGELIRIVKGMPVPDQNSGQAAGALIFEDGRLAAQTGGGLYVIQEIQPAGKQKMSGAAFANGRHNLTGAVFSQLA